MAMPQAGGDGRVPGDGVAVPEVEEDPENSIEVPSIGGGGEQNVALVGAATNPPLTSEE